MHVLNQISCTTERFTSEDINSLCRFYGSVANTDSKWLGKFLQERLDIKMVPPHGHWLHEAQKLCLTTLFRTSVSINCSYLEVLGER